MEWLKLLHSYENAKFSWTKYFYIMLLNKNKNK